MNKTTKFINKNSILIFGVTSILIGLFYKILGYYSADLVAVTCIFGFVIWWRVGMIENKLHQFRREMIKKDLEVKENDERIIRENVSDRSDEAIETLRTA